MGDGQQRVQSYGLVKVGNRQLRLAEVDVRSPPVVVCNNLGATVDFRRVYATAIDGWLGSGRAATVLKGDFETLPVFGIG